MQAAITRMARAYALVCVGLLASAIAIDARAVTTQGSTECVQWARQRAAKTDANLSGEFWLLGYLSGLAAASRTEVFPKESESLFLWVDNYCRSNPRHSLSDAGIALFIELVQGKN